MKIYRNGKEMLLEISDNDKLDYVIAALDRQENEKDMLISDIKIDGVLLTAENEKKLIETQVKDIEKLELKVEKEEEIINRALNESYQYLPRLSQGLEETSLLFQAGSKTEAFNNFSECLNGWLQIVNLLQNIEKALQISYANIELQEGTIQDFNDKLLSMLEETKKAMENDDIVSLSDLIEYELSPMAQKQMEAMQKLIDLVKEKLSK